MPKNKNNTNMLNVKGKNTKSRNSRGALIQQPTKQKGKISRWNEIAEGPLDEYHSNLLIGQLFIQ